MPEVWTKQRNKETKGRGWKNQRAILVGGSRLENFARHVSRFELRSCLFHDAKPGMFL